jgi:hypothetical protein
MIISAAIIQGNAGVRGEYLWAYHCGAGELRGVEIERVQGEDF